MSTPKLPKGFPQASGGLRLAQLPGHSQVAKYFSLLYLHHTCHCTSCLPRWPEDSRMR